jgi:Fuc2NAc and GlcNAc transferase
MESLITVFLIPLILALGLSKLVIYWFGRQLLDIPNNRSSHTTPTPRGGGIAIVLATLIAMLVAYTSGLISHVTLYLLAPGLLMAVLGISDDLITLNIRIRLIIQLVTACITTGAILNSTPLSIPMAALLGVAAIIGIVWLTNLYNFMDGINGLAALQTVFACCSMSFLFYLQGDYNETIPLMLALGSASLGFLYWNFPHAKLFMGDAGSLFIGITLATLMTWTARNDLITACSWLIVLAVFIVDASYTLTFRLVTGQKFYQPHRSHFYQKIAIKLNSHTKATLLLISFNLFWLFPIALVVQLGKINVIAALCLAYLPTVYGTYRIKAGKPE